MGRAKRFVGGQPGQRMKGMIFTEFLEMVELKFGLETVNEVIDAANLPSGGAYSAVGRYDHREMVQLVYQLSQRSGLEVPALLRAFGGYLFNVFTRQYAEMIETSESGFDLLERVDREIHIEVLKLYPDAELPSFETERLADNLLQMDYRSDRAMGDLAHGLIEACAQHFNERYQIAVTPRARDGKYVRFHIEREA